IAHAGGAAAIDLVLETRARTVFEHRVPALPQAEEAIDLVERLTYGPRAGERAEITVRRLARAAVEADTRIIVAHLQADPGIALVVTKIDVEARSMGLDPFIFQQQGLGFGARQADFHARDLAHHEVQPGAQVAPAEIAGHPAPQIARLADIQHLAFGITHQVDARTRAQAAGKSWPVKALFHRRRPSSSTRRSAATSSMSITRLNPSSPP